PVEAHVLEVVQGVGDVDLAVALGEVVDDDAELLLADLEVDVRVVLGQRLVEDGAAEGGLPQLAVDPDLDLALQRDLAALERHLSLGGRDEGATLARTTVTLEREEVQADDHVLRRHGDRTAVGRLEDVVRREHQDARLSLGLGGQRQVHGHLVTVEVGVEGRADQRVDLDGLALDQLRLERLDAQTVQRGRTVQQHRVLGDDLFEHVPHDRAGTLDHALGALDVLRVVQVDQTLHHERLEQLQGHLLGQTALVQLQLRTDDDDRAAGVVDALAEQVLTEATLLALEHVRDRLQRAIARAGDRTTAATVVEQRVDGLLQHPLLVV